MQFRLFNIPITVHLSFWFFLLFYSANPGVHPVKIALIAIIMAGSLLFHELGHALAAVKFGKKPEITMEAFGGYTSYCSSHLDGAKHFVITLCGPLFTALLIGLGYFFLKSHLFSTYWPNFFCYALMHLNIYWLLINLSPLQPLDGGKLAGYLFQKYWGPRGEWLALHLGNLTALAGIGYFLWSNNFVFALLFAFYGLKNFQASQAHSFSKKDSNSFTLLNEAMHLSEEDELEKAQKILKKLIRSQDDYIRNHALEERAIILEKQGNEKEAYALFLQIDLAKMTKGCLPFMKLAYRNQHYQTIAGNAHTCYQICPSLETALLNAKAFTHLGNTDLAEGWLNTAKQFESFSESESSSIYLKS